MDGTSLQDRIDDVESASANEKSLLTLSIPPETDLGTVLEQVEEEHAEAEYLDTEHTTQAIRRALDRAGDLLQQFDGTPDTGLIVYVGVDESGSLIEYVFDDLPATVQEFTYTRGHSFDTDPLETTANPSPTYGLLVVERGGAALGLLDGDRVTTLETLDSDVMGKTRAGGQSADRFERRRAEQKAAFFDEVAGEAARCFLADAAIDGLLVGGTTITVDDFLDGDYLDPALRERVLGDSFSVEYASEQGLRDLAKRARERREEFERRPAEDALDRFFSALAGDDPVVYGTEDVERALTFDAVDLLLLSESLSPAELHSYEERVEEEGGEYVVVPTSLDRGAQFSEGFGGVGALLRFPVD